MLPCRDLSENFVLIFSLTGSYRLSDFRFFYPPPFCFVFLDFFCLFFYSDVDVCFPNLHFIQLSYGKAIQVCKVIYFTALFSSFACAPWAVSEVFWEAEVSVFSFNNLP